MHWPKEYLLQRNILCSPGTIIDSTSSKAFVALIITIAIKTSYHSYHIVWESLWYSQTSWADIRWWVQVQVLKSKRIKRAHVLLCLVEFDSKRIAFTQPLCTKPYLHNENLDLEYINRHAQMYLFKIESVWVLSSDIEFGWSSPSGLRCSAFLWMEKLRHQVCRNLLVFRKHFNLHPYWVFCFKNCITCKKGNNKVTCDMHNANLEIFNAMNLANISFDRNIFFFLFVRLWKMCLPLDGVLNCE